MPKRRKWGARERPGAAGKPAPLFATLTKDDGLRLLTIPGNPTLTAAYPPVRLTAADYPALVSPDEHGTGESVVAMTNGIQDGLAHRTFAEGWNALHQ